MEFTQLIDYLSLSADNSDFVHDLSQITLMLGLLGLLMMTILFPLLSAIFVLLSKKSRLKKSVSQSSSIKIDVLIPVHNEQKELQASLNSINAALKKSCIPIDFRIIVCIDGDNPAAYNIAASCGAEVIVNKSNLGKWLSLQNLLSHSRTDCEWVAFVDSGSIWEQEFLNKISEDLSNPQIIGINPAYYNDNSGLLIRACWFIERKLKQLENLSGGPISVHGACVIYRKNYLQNIFDILKYQSWLNDDIVLPLMLRARFPQYKLLYKHSLKVADNQRTDRYTEQNRRQRMMLGNIQWIRQIFPDVCKHSPVIAILAMRRIFRVFWSYIFCLLTISTLLIISNSEFNSIYFYGIGLLLILTVLRLPALRTALLASFSSPIYLIKFCSGKVVWK